MGAIERMCFKVDRSEFSLCYLVVECLWEVLQPSGDICQETFLVVIVGRVGLLQVDERVEVRDSAKHPPGTQVSHHSKVIWPQMLIVPRLRNPVNHNMSLCFLICKMGVKNSYLMGC